MPHRAPSFRLAGRPVAMHLDLTQAFPVGLDALWATLGRADYVERKYRALGSTAFRMLRFAADDASIEVELERQAPVARDALPAWARVFSGRRQALRQRTRWTRAARDRVDVALDLRALDMPVGATGTGTVVEPSPGRSRMTLHLEVRSTAAIVGERMAQVFARQVQHALEADHDFTLRELQDRAHRP